MDLLNILVPHKNQPRKLKRLLDSIPQNIPIIVIDDLSSEDVFTEIEQFIGSKYPNVSLFKNTADVHNAGTARNVALDKCKSEWVIFADSDDEFIFEKFSTITHKLKESQSDIIFFNVEALRECNKSKSSRVDYFRKQVSEWPNSKSTIAYSWVVPWGKAIRKETTIDKYDIKFASKIASNDTEFSIKLASVTNKIDLLNETVYRCYESSNSLTATINPVKARDRLKASCTANLIMIKHRVPLYYNYNVQFFKESLPLIIKEKDFKTFGEFLINFVVASIGNTIF